MRVTPSTLRGLLVLLSVIAVTACATTGPKSPSAPRVAFVSVENHNYLDVAVYASHPGGQRSRVGTVTGVSTATFALPRDVVSYGSVLLVAVPIGGFGSARSGQVSVAAGDTVVFTVEQRLALSTVTIRP